MRTLPKLLAPVVVTVIAGGAGLFFYQGSVSEQAMEAQQAEVEAMVEQQLRGEFEQLAQQTTSSIAEVAHENTVRARMFAQSPWTIEAFSTAHTGDIHDENSPQSQAGREQIRSGIAPHLAGVTSGGEATPKFHFLMPNGRSLCRAWRDGWQTLRNGKKVDISDDVTRFRSMVRNLPTDPGRDIQGIELGRVGLAIRGMTAIRHPNGNLLGMVENIRGFDPVFERLKASGASVGVFLNASGLEIARTLKAQPEKFPVFGGKFCLTQASEVGGIASPNEVDFLQRGAEQLAFEIEGDTARAAWPVHDVQGNQIAVIAVRKSIAAQVARAAAIQTAAKEAGEQVRTGFAIGLAILLGVVLFSLVFTSGRFVFRPTRQLLSSMQDVADGDGDLTQRLPEDGDDEFADLARTTNRVFERIHRTVKTVQDQVVRLRAEAQSLEGTASEMSSTSGSLADESHTLAATVEEFSASMNEVNDGTTDIANRMTESEAAMNEVADGVQRISGSSAQARETTESARELANDSLERIGELTQAAGEIGKVIEVIDQIAKQTNLLALNATIEASRAGAAGRGFAVVAGEVKELASQTSRATGEITAQIEAIQKACKSSSADVTNISEAVLDVAAQFTGIAEVLREQEALTESFRAMLTQSADAARNAGAHCDEASQTSRTIAGSFVGLQEVTSKSEQLSSKTAVSSAKVLEATTAIQQQVERFRC